MFYSFCLDAFDTLYTGIERVTGVPCCDVMPIISLQIGTNHFDSRDSILYLLNRFIANFHSFGEKSAIEREEAAYRMLAARTCE